MLEEILQYNKEFVESKAYEKYAASKYPNKNLRFYLVWILD